MRGTGTAAVLELCDVASVAYVSTPVKSSTTVAHSFLRLVSKVQDAALRSTLLLSYCRHLNEHREQVWRNIIILFDVQRIAVPCVWFGDLESLKNEVELPVPMVLDGNKLTAQRSKRRAQHGLRFSDSQHADSGHRMHSYLLWPRDNAHTCQVSPS